MKMTHRIIINQIKTLSQPPIHTRYPLVLEKISNHKFHTPTPDLRVPCRILVRLLCRILLTCLDRIRARLNPIRVVPEASQQQHVVPFPAPGHQRAPALLEPGCRVIGNGRPEQFGALFERVDESGVGRAAVPGQEVASFPEIVPARWVGGGVAV